MCAMGSPSRLPFLRKRLISVLRARCITRPSHFNPRTQNFAHGLHSCLVRIFSAHSLSQREERILQHKANRHLRLAFNTQFPWIACKKSKPSFPQFLPHECLSAGRHLTRRLRMSSLGANLCAYLADSAPHAFANVGFHCGTASVDPQEACCDW